MRCDCSQPLSKNCSRANTAKTIIVIMIFGGKNCFIKNRCNCFGAAQSVTSYLISSLLDATVNWMNNVNMSRANKSITNPVIHEIFTTASSICLYLLKRVLSASVVRPWLSKYFTSSGLPGSLVRITMRDGFAFCSVPNCLLAQSIKGCGTNTEEMRSLKPTTLP